LSAISICSSAALVEGGDGVRFPVSTRDGQAVGFVVRFQGVPRGYLNRCAHVGIELDWQRGKFFDGSRLYLMCATHGAIYEPESGRCAGGPCRGQGLRVIAIEERDGTVYWLPDPQVFAAPATTLPISRTDP
jgi:nitrite reductase/ring-hydroxylating ferredoxin subunit